MPIAGNLHYFFHEGGDASRPPVVLIHGEGGDHLTWPSEMRRLPGYRVYTLDLPGHGRSEGPGMQAAADYARSVLAFINATGMSSAVLVGHGLGGAVALTLAGERAERTAGLVLVASGARLPIAPAVMENAANPATFPLALQALQAAMFANPAETRVKAAAFERLSAVRQTLLFGDLLACDTFDQSAGLAALRTPTLVVCGTEDRLTPLRLSEALAGSIPGAALQTVDGSGHLVMLEQPHRLAGLLAVFLATVPYRPGA
jgi:pimeloyl-ACP methyl ester carboxylesterase